MRAVHLALEDLPRVLEGVARRAVDLRHAAQRVVVLDLAAAAVGLADGAASKEAPQVLRRGRRLPDAGGPTRITRVEGGVRAAGRVERGRPGDIGHAAEKSARARARPPTATDIWTPLTSASPSLAASDDRPETGVAERAAGRQEASRRRDAPSPISASAR